MDKFDKYSYFFELPLYAKIQIEENELEPFIELLYFAGRIDAYNPALKEKTTYSIASYPKREGYIAFTNHSGIVTHNLKCVRTNETDFIFSHFDGKNRILQKVGQFPSIADFHISQIKQYDSVLQKKQLKELTRAIGLAANGVGIGSFVYLRRIFEVLLEEAHIKAQAQLEWDENKYQSSRVTEKIELLQNYLPLFLVENKTLYGILSKGIHSLTENECLAYFETVRVGIELILDEKLEQFEKNKKVEEARKKISSVSSRLK